MENDKRNSEHRKNSVLENIFPEMEKLLGNSELEALKDFHHPTLPVLFIVGCARSGSTLLYQFLASSRLFGYPSNLISRFYYAPYLGVRIQQLLLDSDFKGEIFGNRIQQGSFISDLGKTQGPREPHEFWYFWNRFFKFENVQVLSDSSLRKIDWELFFKELHAMESAFQLPLVMKAMNMNYHLTDLSRKSERIHFLHVKRDVISNAISLLIARKKFFGTYEQWYSFRPPNYVELMKKPVWEQVVDQVVETNMVIEKQLLALDSSRYTIINYETFTESTTGFVNHFSDLIKIPLKNTNYKKSFPYITPSVVDNELLVKISNYFNDNYK